MRIIFLVLVVLLFGCNQYNSQTVSISTNEKKRVAEAQTQRVIEILQKKPEWLFTGDACPTEVMPNYDRKIEYKALGCADNPDECLEKCKVDDANACYALSLLIDEQRGKEGDDTQALYLRACKLGIVSGCTNYAAGESNLNPEDKQTAKCSADTFEIACSKNDSWGCSMYGLALGNGLGREKNTEEAIKVLQKACTIANENSQACISARKTEELIKRVEKLSKEVKESNNKP